MAKITSVKTSADNNKLFTAQINDDNTREFKEYNIGSGINNKTLLETADVTSFDDGMDVITVNPSGDKFLGVDRRGREVINMETSNNFSVNVLSTLGSYVISKTQSFDYENMIYGSSFHVGWGRLSGTNPTGFYMDESGTNFYALRYLSEDAIYQFSLSTPFDFSTATRIRGVLLPTGTPWGVQFIPDGSRFYYSDYNNGNIYQYNLTTPWNISTASYVGPVLSGGSRRLFKYSNNGNKLFTDPDVNKINEYNLSTPYDISTATFAKQYNINDGVDVIFGSISNDGYYMATWSGDNTYYYDLSSPFDINSRTLVYTFNRAKHQFRDVDWDRRYAYYRDDRRPTLYTIPLK